MKTSCRECGFPYDPARESLCPKCGSGMDHFGFAPALEIDVVHAGETWLEAKRKIEHGLDRAIWGHHKGLKVIHGYGSLSGVSVIAPQAITYMRHLAELHDGRFAKDQKNPGVSIIWLNQKAKALTKTNEANQKPSPPFAGNWFDEALKKRDM